MPLLLIDKEVLCIACQGQYPTAQVGPRKKVLDLLAAVYLSGGRGAAYDVYSRLPHNEQGLAGFDAAEAAAAMGLSAA